MSIQTAVIADVDRTSVIVLTRTTASHGTAGGVGSPVLSQAGDL